MKNRLKQTIIILMIPVIIVILLGFIKRDINRKTYNSAVICFQNRQFEKAYEQFNAIKDFRDASKFAVVADYGTHLNSANEFIKESKYTEANKEISLIDEKKIHNASIGNKDRLKVEKAYHNSKYKVAIGLYKDGEYEEARTVFEELDGYENSGLYLAQIDVKTIDRKKNTLYNTAIKRYNSGDYKDALDTFEMLDDFNGDSKKWCEKCRIQIRRRNLNNTIAAGVRNSASIGDDGTVFYTNNNIFGLNDSKTWKNVISIDTYGSLIIGLMNDHTVKVAGKADNSSVDTALWRNIIDIAAGEQFVVALNKNGTVMADGHNGDGQCDVSKWRNVTDVDAGWRFAVGLTDNGKLLFSGYDAGQKKDYEQQKSEWKDVVKISAGGGGYSAFSRATRGNGHTVGLKSDGTVVAIGDNTYGQCEVKNWKNIVRVSAGDWYTVGLKSDGTILITGQNAPGFRYIDEELVDNLTNVIDIAAGYGQSLCLEKDGSIVAFGFDDDNKMSAINGWSEGVTMSSLVNKSIINTRH